MFAATTLFNMIKKGGEDCAKQISFGRAYHLFQNEKTLVDFVKMANPNIVIFSTGAHLKTKEEM